MKRIWCILFGHHGGWVKFTNINATSFHSDGSLDKIYDFYLCKRCFSLYAKINNGK